MTRAYYNEIDPWCCDVLRGLIAAGELPDGDVDNRDIRLVQPHELEGYAQIHLFAGMGGGPLACRIAGVPDDFPIITAGVPCQPASQAGKRLGRHDERWLWPEFFRLLRHLRSHDALVEQPTGIVSLNDGHEWNWILGQLAEIVSDIEVSRVSAEEVGAPQERDRIWIVAYAASGGRRARRRESVRRVAGKCAGLGDTRSAGREERDAATESARAGHPAGERAGMGDTQLQRRERRQGAGREALHGSEHARNELGGRGALRPWADAVAVRGYDDSVRLIPREAAEAGPQSPLRSLVDGLSRLVAGLRADDLTEEIDAETREAARAEAVRMVWGDDGAQAHQRAPRGRECFCAEKILLAVMCEQSRDGDAEWGQAARAEVPQGILRKLRCDDEAGCASHRREPAEQRARELADRVSRLPNALASRAAETWYHYARARAGLWPVSDGAPGRVAKLRAIGNAWCPQAAVPALRVILAHAMSEASA